MFHVLPFGKDNIKQDDWRHEDAAVLASLGSILEGPDPAQLKTLVKKAMAMLLTKDTAAVVKEMADCTIGHVCEYVSKFQRKLIKFYV